MWDRLKAGWEKRRRGNSAGQAFSEGVHWLEKADNPWGVPVVDIRARTSVAVATTASPEVAAAACSMAHEDGTCFIGIEPEVKTEYAAGLQFRLDQPLAEGSLFRPAVMEHKWAIYYYGGKLIFVRSWLRKVFATADVKVYSDHVEITTLRGLIARVEEPGMVIRTLDYLLRSHALQLPWPAPVPPEFANDLEAMTVYAFSQFGNQAGFATPYAVARTMPEKGLRTDSRLLHAVILDDLPAARAALDNGIPPDILGIQGLTALHCTAGPDLTRLLLERGCPVDVLSDEGATPLMNAAQDGNLETLRLLLNYGANPNAADQRGFTALHRAAERGHFQVAEVLLANGASPSMEAQGYTALSLAQLSKERKLINLLKGRGPLPGVTVS